MLRLLTFNVSAGNVSHLAPPGFSLQEKYDCVVRLVLQHAPQLVSLQELDGPAAAHIWRGLKGSGYHATGSAESHCHGTHIFVHSSLNPTARRPVGPVAIARIPLPLPTTDSVAQQQAAAAAAAAAAAQPAAVAGRPSSPGGGDCFYFAGCHLSPFADGAPDRLHELQSALRSLPPRSKVILAGDLNMRARENAQVEALGLTDAFQAVGAPPQHNFTWDSRVNRYHEDGFAFTARFDRVYLRGFSAADLKIVANQPFSCVPPGGAAAPGGQDGGAEPRTPPRPFTDGDYLSDHYGLTCSVQLLQQQ